MKPESRTIIYTGALFILINLIGFLFRHVFLQHDININFILVANGLLFALTVFSFIMQRKALLSANMQVFIRGVYLSMIVKLFACIIGISIYLIAMSNDINQTALFASMGLYIIYTALEVSGLMKALRKKNA